MNDTSYKIHDLNQLLLFSSFLIIWHYFLFSPRASLNLSILPPSFHTISHSWHYPFLWSFLFHYYYYFRAKIEIYIMLYIYSILYSPPPGIWTSSSSMAMTTIWVLLYHLVFGSCSIHFNMNIWFNVLKTQAIFTNVTN